MKGKEFQKHLKGYNVGDLKNFLKGVLIVIQYLPSDIADAWHIRQLKLMICKVIRQKGGTP